MISSIILCGGKNSRLINYKKKKIIKPLIKYRGQTLIEHHLSNLKKIKVKKNFINTFKNKNAFNNLKKRKKLNFNIINERKLKGTADCSKSQI